MVRITETGYSIEVASASPYEDLQLLGNGLLQLLRDSNEDYNRQHDPKPHICGLLQEIFPSMKQLEHGLSDS